METLLGWCHPDQAHNWGVAKPTHRCPGKLGNIKCSCRCHRKKKVVRRTP